MQSPSPDTTRPQRPPPGTFTPRTWAGIALSAALTGWFVWTIEWGALLGALSEVRLGWVLVASAMLLGEFALRALRWKVLMCRLAPHARVWDLFTATVIGAATNSLLPARAGEIAKPLVASRKVGVPFSSVIATAVLERIYDLMGLVCVLLAMTLTLPDTLGGASEADALLVVKLKRYGALAAVGGLSGMATFLLLSLRGGLSKSLVERLLSPAPAPLRERILGLYDGFIDGLSSVRDGGALARASLISVAIWFNGAAAIYTLFHAFRLELPFGAACFTTVAIAVAVVLPQAPGFFGVFHVAIEKTLVLWSISATPAKAFAIVFWAVSFVPVTAVGLGVLWREGLSLRGIWRDPPKEPPSEPQQGA